jgi:hypothetical protein
MEDKNKQPSVIDVEDTEDEFVIKKPENAGPVYDQFLEELYQHDQGKNTTKPKRSADEEEKNSEKLTVEAPEEFDIPVKPALNVDDNYDQFLTHLYRHDEEKRTRQKRMIVFRHESLRESQSV